MVGRVAKIFSFFLLGASMFLILFASLSYAKTPSFTFKNGDTAMGGRLFFDDVLPGEVIDGYLSINLLENVPTVFDISFIDNFGNKLNKLKLTEQDKDYFSYVNWIDLKVRGLKYLEGMGTLDLPFTINVPEGALPGDYSGLFIAAIDSFGEKALKKIEEGVDDSSVLGSGAKLSLGIAIEFFLRVKGEVNPGLELTGLSYFKEETTEKFNLSIAYENIGNVILKPRAYVKIKNIWDREMYNGEFYLPVIPPYKDSSSVIKLSTKDFYLDYGVYDVDVELFYDVFSRELGENMVYLAGRANLRIYYFPWYLFAIIAFIIVLVFVIIFYKNLIFYLYARNVKEYVVKNHDTLQLVSEKFKVDPKKIIVINKIKAPYFLMVGQKILIPLSKKNENK